MYESSSTQVDSFKRNAESKDTFENLTKSKVRSYVPNKNLELYLKPKTT